MWKASVDIHLGLDQDDKPDGKYSAISDVQGFLCGTIMAIGVVELWRLRPSIVYSLHGWHPRIVVVHVLTMIMK
jgi:hypothetical protein